VVLLDEVEKAHPDVHELFFQVFDKGWMEDGQGTRVDFKNTIILLTSNAGSDVIMRMCEQGRQRPADNELQKALRPALLEVFPAALLGRMVTIPYYPLSDEMLGSIVRLQLDRVGKRVEEQYEIPFTYDQAVVDLITSRCTEVESGGRMIDAVLTNALLPQMSRELLRRNLDGVPAKKAEVTASAGEFGFAFE
jgi:type VI secretion system protein VasG